MDTVHTSVSVHSANIHALAALRSMKVAEERPPFASKIRVHQIFNKILYLHLLYKKYWCTRALKKDNKENR